MNDYGTFLAHAIQLEQDAAERFDELADAMDVHNNADAATLFREMAEFSRKHLAEVREHAGSTPVPHLSPWEFAWPAEESPESGAIEDSHYLMTPWHCLQLALKSERRGHEFYKSVAEATGNAQVRALAAEMAEEEAGHVAILEKWLAKTPKPDRDWDLDLDPPRVED